MPSRLSDVYKSRPVQPFHKPLDLSSLEELPDSYKWSTQPNDYPSRDCLTSESIPVIDLSLPNALELIGHACRTWGAFQVVNHGVPFTLLEDIENTAISLFSLPTHQKLKATRSPEGISGYGRLPISSFFSKLMWSEGFTIAGSPFEHFRRLWPQNYTKFCDVVEEYEHVMNRLCERIMWLVLESLGISKEDIKWASPSGELRGETAAMQLNSYPACPDPDRAMGLAAHTDSTFLTILRQNSTSGLQVLREGWWVTVPPIQGALIVNVGDLLHILSNGLYPSVLHRAMVNRNSQRISIAYFYVPPTSVQISPLSKLVSPARPPLYRSVTWNEYLGTKAKHFDKALSSVQLCVPLNGLLDLNDHTRVEVG